MFERDNGEMRNGMPSVYREIWSDSDLKYDRPMKSEYFGIPIHYRVEDRRGGEYKVLILSCRLQTKILYEHPPVRVKDLEQLLERYQHDEIVEGKTFLEALPQKVMDQFFQSFLSVTPKKPEQVDSKKLEEWRRERTGWREQIEIPLAAMFAADREIINDKSRSDNIVTRDNKAMEVLCRHVGTIPWQKVTPQACADWIYRAEYSDDMRFSIKRVMTRFLKYQWGLGIPCEMSWVCFECQRSERPLYSLTSARRRSTGPIMLSYGQCYELLESIIEKNHKRKRGYTRMDLALLLLITANLSVEEICALNIEDFGYLPEIKSRMTVHVSKTMGIIKENYKLEDYDDASAKRRVLPLAQMVKEVAEHILRRGRSNGKIKPLLYTGTNNNVRMRPDALRKQFERDFRRVTKKVITLDHYHPKLPALADQTFEQEMKKAGIDSDTMRYIKGLPANSTAGMSYAYFKDAAFLNSIGYAMDRWMTKVANFGRTTETDGIIETKQIGGTLKKVEWRIRSASVCCRIEQDLYLSGMSEEKNIGYVTVEIYAPQGFSGILTSQHKSESPELERENWEGGPMNEIADRDGEGCE